MTLPLLKDLVSFLSGYSDVRGLLSTCKLVILQAPRNASNVQCSLEQLHSWQMSIRMSESCPRTQEAPMFIRRLCEMEQVQSLPELSTI